MGFGAGGKRRGVFPFVRFLAESGRQDFGLYGKDKPAIAEHCIIGTGLEADCGIISAVSDQLLRFPERYAKEGG